MNSDNTKELSSNPKSGGKSRLVRNQIHRQGKDPGINQCDILITGGTILAMDDYNSVFENGSIAIIGERIEHIYAAGTETPSAKNVIDAGGGLVLPGLINTHTHAAMTLFRGLADDIPLMEWLNKYIFPVERRMNSEFVYVGSLLACAEMILSGTTTFCDMYLFEDSVARAAKRAGIRALVGEVLYDFKSPNYGTIDNGFRYTETLINNWHDDPLVSIAVEPHSPFTCSPDLLKTANRLALKHHAPFIVHLSETLAEINEVKKRYGRRPVEHLENLGILGPHCLAAHCVHLLEQEIKILSERDVKVAHNPESNMKLASGIAPVPEMIARGITVALGTDGCASNNNLDMFEEMDMAAKLHKVNAMDTTALDALTVMRMATIEGAKALGMGEHVGSLEKGKKADIIIVNVHRPHLTPLYNPYSHLVYAVRGSDVSHCIINGSLVMENRKLLTMDQVELMKKAREKSFDVIKWLSA